MPDLPARRIAIVGGTGHLGLGLARRLRQAGAEVLIGSRDPQRARAAAEAAGLPAGQGRLNADAAEAADLVIITVPFDGHEATVRALAPLLAGKVLLETTVPYDRRSRTVILPDGISAAERAQQLAPTARVVAGFHTVSAVMLADAAAQLRGDVLLCSDHAAATAAVAALVHAIGMRPVDAGALASARTLELMAGLLLGLNRRYKQRDLGITIAGLDL